MNFGLPNLTKQKKKRNLGTQQNVTTFSQYFLFPAMVGFNLILLFYFLHPQHFHGKSLVKNYY